MFARFTIVQVNVDTVDEVIKLSVLSQLLNHRKVIVVQIYSLIAKQAKVILLPYGIVKRTPLKTIRAGTTKNRWANSLNT